MSLLNRGTEVVKVFQEIATPEVDSDGNTVTRPAKVGSVFKASVQPISSTEDTDGGGFHTVTRYRLRLVGYPGVLGAQSQVEWRGKRYAIEGDAKVFTASPRTARAEYVMTRK